MPESVYKITNKVNGKFYIGYTSQKLRRRFSKHISDALCSGKKSHLANAIRKHGKDSFIIELIQEFDDKESAHDMERKLIKNLKAQDVKIGYNIADGGEGGVTPEMALNISKALKGRKRTPEHIENWKKSKANSSYVASEETRRKHAENARNRVIKEETRIKIGNIHRGKVVSEETRAKLSAAKKGKTPAIVEVECPHCNKVGSSKIMPRWHFDNCKENPNLTEAQKDELTKKRSDNIKNSLTVAHENLRNGTRKGSWLGKKQPVVNCPHCEVQGGISNMKRFHFDNCKLKEIS